jgi:2-amino-4-hydroxy-6-hydroxymethyldihydropteridine diphosphokinase
MTATHPFPDRKKLPVQPLPMEPGGPARRMAAVSLGSNEGDRMAHLRAAFAWCEAVALAGARGSAVYETAPVGCPPGSPPFLNAAVVFETSCEARPLLEAMRALERLRGRSEGGARNAPRPLDMDLLLLGDLRVEEEGLVLPHPRMLQREFVLRPLCELEPGWVPPGAGRPLKDFLDSLPASGDVRPWKEPLR